jgi:hypothetical protein
VNNRVDDDQSYTVYIYDESGIAVEDANVWVSYASVAKAPLYTTNSNGKVYLDLREKKRTQFHSIIVKKNGKKANIPKRTVKKWPLKIVIK